MATFVILLDETDFFSVEVSVVYNRLKVVSWNACKYLAWQLKDQPSVAKINCS